MTLNVGSRLPAYCTSIGQVLLAHLPPAELDAYFARVDLHAYTEYTPATRKQLREQVLLARRADYAIADQQMELGMRSIAVPIRNSAGAVVAGINVIVQAGAGAARRLQTMYLPQLQSAARELGAQLVA